MLGTATGNAASKDADMTCGVGQGEPGDAVQSHLVARSSAILLARRVARSPAALMRVRKTGMITRSVKSAETMPNTAPTHAAKLSAQQYNSRNK